MTDDQILDRILAAEGGYVDDSRDAGGATNYGITIGTLGSWRGHPVTKDDVRQLTEDEARAIYRARYLAPFASVDPEHKPQVVDIAVNSGITTARALYAVAQANHGARSVNNQLAIERLKHYGRITKTKPTNVIFLNGWIARACSFITALVICVAPVCAQDGGEPLTARPITSLGVIIPLPIGTAESADRYHRIPLADVKTTRWTHACVVATVTYHRKEADGDMHLRLEDGRAFVVAEIIPQIPLPTPRTGSRVTVCGITRFDRHHGWAELHPVTSITVMPR